MLIINKHLLFFLGNLKSVKITLFNINYIVKSYTLLQWKPSYQNNWKNFTVENLKKVKIPFNYHFIFSCSVMMAQKHRFPTQEDITRIFDMYKKGYRVAEIAEVLGFTNRNIRVVLRRSSKTMEWTEEEIQILIDKYRQGITNIYALQPFIPHKSYFSIRNKIIFLIKKGTI